MMQAGLNGRGLFFKSLSSDLLEVLRATRRKASSDAKASIYLLADYISRIGFFQSQSQIRSSKR